MQEDASSRELTPFCIVAGRDGMAQVEAWSTHRLPFEPRGWLLEFRDRLRTAVGSLNAKSNELLHAVYASPEHGNCDTENILFYNVGTGRFAKAARYGLRFERAFETPISCPHELSGKPRHYCRYFLTSNETLFSHWEPGRVLAQWSIDCGAKSILGHCATVWYAMKTGYVRTAAEPRSPGQPFCLRVRVAAPPGVSLRLAGLMKPVFDGVISALHQHDGTCEQEVGRRLAERLGAAPEAIAGLLGSDAGTVLGKRCLVRPYRRNVMWNPQDDLCLAGELIEEKAGQKQNLSISGELHEL